MPTTPTDILDRLRAANPAPVSPERAQAPTVRTTLERILNDSDPDAGSGSPRPTHPRRRRWLRAAPVLAAMLITLVVLGGALTLLGRRHGPVSGSRSPSGGIAALIAHTPKRQLDRELTYVFAAMGSVQNSKPCRLQQPSGVTYIQGSPGSDLLSILPVLRRPANLADRLNPQAIGPVPDVYRSYIRRAFSAGGVSYYIVPSRFDRAASIPSDRCFALQRTALDHDLSKIPVSLRQSSREIEAAMIAYWRSIDSVDQGSLDRICLVTVAGNGTGSSCGIAPKGIESGFATENSLGMPLDTFSGVVPNDVATVTLVFPPPAHAVTIRVEDNVYAVRFTFHPVRGSHPTPSPTIIWRSSDGRVLKRVSTSEAAERAYICKQSPGACLFVLASNAARSSSSGGSSSTAPIRSTPARTRGVRVPAAAHG